MRKKLIGILLTVCISAGMLCGCAEKDSRDSASTGKPTIVSNIAENSDLYESNIMVGSDITMGTYEQDGNSSNGAEPIEWKVLAIEDNKALVISKYVLDLKPYHEEDTEVNWSECSLRMWLNGNFYAESFSENEKDKIVETIITENNVETNDNIFLLNKSELEKYLPTKDDRICEPTLFFKQSTKESFENGQGCRYWICTSGKRDTAYYVGMKGKLDGQPDGVTYNQGVRPAMWIKIK